ncbi:hypothetical protein [Natronorubrum halophilum]|uniref:hypothetical protein n=1 Tax=Natronorubrum halophilum TaxID=1702106 RepID=UPI0010C1FAAA|nr:hypothetical protein [Natronorubrum halophilum]
MTGRKNAMLTTEDRRWLTGEKTYEGEHAKQQRYQRRRDIRDRVYNSLLDFSILFEYLEEAEREKLFGTSGGDQQPLIEDRELSDGIRDGLAFLLYNTGITATMNSSDDHPDVAAERLLIDAIYQAGETDGILVEGVSLDIEAVDLSQSSLLDDLEDGNELSPREIRVLLESESIDTQEVQETIRKQVFDE